MAQILNLDVAQNTALVSLNDGTQALTTINEFPFQLTKGMNIDLQLNGSQLVGTLNGQHYVITRFQVANQAQTTDQRVGQGMDKISENKQVQVAKQAITAGLSDKSFGRTTTILFAVSVVFLFLVNIFAAMAGRVQLQNTTTMISSEIRMGMDNNFALYIASLFNIFNIIVIFLLLGILIFKAITNFNYIKQNSILFGMITGIGALSLIVSFVMQGVYWAIEAVIQQPITRERNADLMQSGVTKTFGAFFRGDYGWAIGMQVVLLIFGILVAALAYLQFFKWSKENVFVKLKNMLSQQSGQQPQQRGQQPQQFGQQPQQFGQQPQQFDQEQSQQQ